MAAALPLLSSKLSASVLPTGVLNPAQVKAQVQPFGTLRVYHEGATEQLAYMNAGTLELKPGMEPHPPHTHPEEEFMYIASGTGEIYVDGNTTKIGPGSIMFTKANQLHGIKNTGTLPITFFYCKWRTH